MPKRRMSHHFINADLKYDHQIVHADSSGKQTMRGTGQQLVLARQPSFIKD